MPNQSNPASIGAASAGRANSEVLASMAVAGGCFAIGTIGVIANSIEPGSSKLTGMMLVGGVYLLMGLFGLASEKIRGNFAASKLARHTPENREPELVKLAEIKQAASEPAQIQSPAA